MDLNWKKTASEMLLAVGGDFSYTIFRNGDSGYWTLGRTHKDDGVMETLWAKFDSPDTAKAYAAEDYDVQAGDDLPPEPQRAS